MKLKSMAITGIVDKDGEKLYKTVVWDDSFLDVRYKLCDAAEVKELATYCIPIDTLNEENLRGRVPCVEYIDLYDAMRVSWIVEATNCMYSYFDCLRWCIENDVNVEVGGAPLKWSEVAVDLDAKSVKCGDIVLFEEGEATPLDVRVEDMPGNVYDVAQWQFGLDGTETYFHYVPAEVISARSQCARLASYARGQGVCGQLYALDQMCGE